MKLTEFCKIKINDPEADFWIVRRGSKEAIGKPTEEFNSEHYGLTVTKPELVLPKYLYYLFEYLWSQGFFKALGRGTLRLVNLRLEDFQHLDFKTN
jgi:hypothetical protein